VFLVAFHIACREVSDLALAISFTTPVIPDSHLRLQIIFSMSGISSFYHSNWRLAFTAQMGKSPSNPFFMLMTVQPFLFAAVLSSAAAAGPATGANRAIDANSTEQSFVGR